MNHSLRIGTIAFALTTITVLLTGCGSGQSSNSDSGYTPIYSGTSSGSTSGGTSGGTAPSSPSLLGDWVGTMSIAGASGSAPVALTITGAGIGGTVGSSSNGLGIQGTISSDREVTISLYALAGYGFYSGSGRASYSGGTLQINVNLTDGSQVTFRLRRG